MIARRNKGFFVLLSICYACFLAGTVYSYYKSYERAHQRWVVEWLSPQLASVGRAYWFESEAHDISGSLDEVLESARVEASPAGILEDNKVLHVGKLVIAEPDSTLYTRYADVVIQGETVTVEYQVKPFWQTRFLLFLSLIFLGFAVAMYRLWPRPYTMAQQMALTSGVPFDYLRYKKFARAFHGEKDLDFIVKLCLLEGLGPDEIANICLSGRLMAAWSACEQNGWSTEHTKDYIQYLTENENGVLPEEIYYPWIELLTTRYAVPFSEAVSVYPRPGPLQFFDEYQIEDGKYRPCLQIEPVKIFSLEPRQYALFKVIGSRTLEGDYVLRPAANRTDQRLVDDVAKVYDDLPGARVRKNSELSAANVNSMISKINSCLFDFLGPCVSEKYKIESLKDAGSDKTYYKVNCQMVL